MQQNIWNSQVNMFLSFLFVGSFALGAGLIIWHATFGENPLANAMAAQMSADTQP